MDRGPWIPPAPAHTSTALLVVVVGCRRLSSRLHPTHASTQHEEQFGDRQEGRTGEWHGARGVWPARGILRASPLGRKEEGGACSVRHVHTRLYQPMSIPFVARAHDVHSQLPEFRSQSTAPTVWRTRAGELERREPQCHRPQHRLCRSVNALLLFTSQDINKL